MTTAEFLLKKFGLLATLDDVAALFKADADGLRQAVARKSPGLGATLAPAKTKKGRRIFFKSLILAEIIDREGD